jgi:hypothetical protein
MELSLPECIWPRALRNFRGSADQTMGMHESGATRLCSIGSGHSVYGNVSPVELPAGMRCHQLLTARVKYGHIFATPIRDAKPLAPVESG